jgi:hypothetical protein
MKPNTAYNHATRLISRINSIWSMAHVSGSPHSHILDRTKSEVYGDAAWPKLPRWARDMVTSHASSTLDEYMKYHMVWAFESLSGEILTWDSLTDDDRSQYRGEKTGQRYWLKPLFQKPIISGGKLTESREVSKNAF